jgi:hypothetical protein
VGKRRLLADLKAEKWGRWTVIREVKAKKYFYKKTKKHIVKRRMECLCECGTKRIVSLEQLTRGKSRSCGCFQKENTSKIHKTHGASFTKMYKIWTGMKTRCYRKKYTAYKYYGGRGIKVCKRWHKFENFLKDMGPYVKGATIDRIDNNKGYSLKNCRWATRAEQVENRRNAIYVILDGNKLPLKAAAKTLNMRYDSLWGRRKRFLKKHPNKQFKIFTKDFKCNKTLINGLIGV